MRIWRGNILKPLAAADTVTLNLSAVGRKQAFSMELTNIEKLEIARKRAGYTQKELAGLIGISLPTYGRIVAKDNIDDILFVHAVCLEKILKVKFTVIDGPQGRRVDIEL